MRHVLPALLVLLAPLAAVAASPSLVMTHSGRLLDNTDAPVTGPQSLKFEIHTSAVPNAQDQVVWSDTYTNVVVGANGVFTVALGDTSSTGGGHTVLSGDQFTGARWLSIAVNNVALSPWLQIGAAPYALNAAAVAGLVPTATPAPGALLLLDSNGRFPASALPAASATAAGVVSATDWASFDGKLAKVATGAGLTGDGTSANPLAVTQVGVTVDAPLAGTGTSASHLTIATATATQAGAVSAADWAAFNGKLAKVSTGAGLTGDGTSASPLAVTQVGVTVDAPLTGSGTSASHLAIPTATGSQAGALSAADWTAFNGKAPGSGSANYIQNGTGSQAGASFNIDGNGTVGGTLQGGTIRSTGKIIGGLGETRDNPGTSCANINTQRAGLASGAYWVKPSSSSVPFEVYCDMTTDGGGWTLVWSNLRNGRGKITTELPWAAAINMTSRYRGRLSADLETFEVYTGLKHWGPLAPNALLRYDWSRDYAVGIDQRSKMNFQLIATNAYQLVLTNAVQMVGSTTPGLLTNHNNMKFSTFDADNDTAGSSNCAAQYTNTPWWYESCWGGNINGGGEDKNGYQNAAYWSGSAAGVGTAAGAGGGNGWMFVK